MLQVQNLDKIEALCRKIFFNIFKVHCYGVQLFSSVFGYNFFTRIDEGLNAFQIAYRHEF
jgi:hypothetical protein